ncbi:unnamed protein product [Rotaria sordida]|uniref:G-protein coupled receptors family 1 profile domain-containing protein n=2 Tax=Rotaria sordida TaxID=392033 RepID=A0A814KJ09_9BILA|nr:unnamed protein product [Rotaria sordida]CAF1053113.1 unnamed protein product [Rotaria sordida]
MSSSRQLISSITIYLGLPIFICGTLGNLLNIRLLWRTRHNPCAFLFLALSFINCFILVYGLFTRILNVGFYFDWSSTNIIWCKTRTAFSQAGYYISFTCTCLASIDRFLVSCCQEKYRKLSRLSIAIWAVILTIIFWLSLSVPHLVYLELLPSPSTGLISCSLGRYDTFSNYVKYFSFPVYYGLLPSIILTITGLLTYRNTNKLQIIRQRQIFQKQLTSMMLIQIPIILVSTVPYVIFTEYSLSTASMTKSANQKAIELVISNIVSVTCYITFACPFFVFLVSSTSFRKEAKMLFLCRKPILLRTNQIQPFSTHPTKKIQSISMRTNQMAFYPTNSLKKYKTNQNY